MIKFKLLSIDAWREPEGGWTWNDAFTLEDGIFLDESRLTPRKIAAFLRRSGFLNEHSAGRIRVDMHPELCDGYLIEILAKATGEPVFALSTIH